MSLGLAFPTCDNTGLSWGPPQGALPALTLHECLLNTESLASHRAGTQINAALHRLVLLGPPCLLPSTPAAAAGSIRGPDGCAVS